MSEDRIETADSSDSKEDKKITFSKTESKISLNSLTQKSPIVNLFNEKTLMIEKQSAKITSLLKNNTIDMETMNEELDKDPIYNSRI